MCVGPLHSRYFQKYWKLEKNCFPHKFQVDINFSELDKLAIYKCIKGLLLIIDNKEEDNDNCLSHNFAHIKRAHLNINSFF